ncbi:MAG: RIP metalloprotease RseP [Candidatus Jacksonbacteria bacterium RIFOXYA2_FULL_43_12]|nr:MAG: RIP metalloprotease RseP [Candidatus Jacksonbacteria bacterium RIFOXYA2_FULL_43_12]
MFRFNMLLTIIIFFIVLSILVIAHEAGHFIAAKHFGVRVDEFGLGFPPRAKTLFRSADGVNWTLNWLPIGGFVKLKGEDGQNREEPDSFGHKAPWKRIVILSGGVLMNFLLAFLLLTIGYSFGWPQDLTEQKVASKYIKEQNVIIAYVEKNTPAARAGLKAGDFIKSVDGAESTELADIQNLIKSKPNQEVNLEIERNKQLINVALTPGELPINPDTSSKDQNTTPQIGIGVALAKYGVVRYPVYLAIGMGAKNTVVYTGKIMDAFGTLIKDLIVTHKVSPNIGGPVMIAALSGQAARLGWIYIIQFLALLSLNLAIVNFLPIPAMDGGRVLFVLIEKFKGRAISLNVETWIHVIGFWLLIGLTVLITARDIARFQVWDKIKAIIAS